MAAVAPLIVITGPTACGKSALALELAEKWNGEIVCADSRTVYKGMDIGTAKPSKDEQKRVRHWALDVVNPGERFTAADFQRIANGAIQDIRSRGKVPFLVGGTGLYIDAVVLNFVFGPDVDVEAREVLENQSNDQLISLHTKQHIPLPNNLQNHRHLIRSIEKHNSSISRKEAPDVNTFVFALEVEKEVLRKRIRSRIEAMFDANVLLETQRIIDVYGPSSEAMTGNVYRIIHKLMNGDIDEGSAVKLCVTRDWHLAKRQLTWLRRHDYIGWLTTNDARHAIESILEKHRDA